MPVNPPAETPDRRGLAWFLAFRVAVITLFLGGTAVFFLQGKMGSQSAPYLFLLLALSYLQSLISALSLLQIKRFALFAKLQLFWDLGFATCLLLITGGIESPFAFIYLLVIISGSFLLPRRQTLYMAATAAIFYGGLLDLQYFGYLPNFFRPPTQQDAAVYLYTVFVHVFAFLLCGLLSGALAERWQRSEAELQRKKIDYQELEQFNRTIVSHISSGLMMINRQGRIRSFNQAAQDITGYRLEEVYDRRPEEIFPQLKLKEQAQYPFISRAEAQIENQRHEKIVLGYATMPIRGHQNAEDGLLVTFQDLTQLKIIEAQLQRADRLASVGRLAAGMAHEIRNPLASISGSVQLLLEESQLNPQDQRLMEIVQREAERLSKLLSDFLEYARPRPLCKQILPLATFLNELKDFVSGDSRFSHIHLDIQCPSDVTLHVDADMLRQALWNLLLNAVDAMQGQGLLSIVYDPVKKSLQVSDTGPGIAPEIRSTVFDPFFSTKEKGTGLGLAIVHSFMDLHDGRIYLGESTSGGATFHLIFNQE
jgi:two-component system sensor histidine kinase PilS (NtrC family)